MGRPAGIVARSAFRLAGACALPALLLSGLADCYQSDEGTAPPRNEFYFPVGLQVSAGGNVLYAVNSNFDLQYNGGTLQSYDLRQLRHDTVRVIADPRQAAAGPPETRVPVLDIPPAGDLPCPDQGRPGETLGETCAPPVDSTFYVRNSAIVGAFATDLLLSKPPSALLPQTPQTDPNEVLSTGERTYDRLFAPVRGNASVTWASVVRDNADVRPLPWSNKTEPPPYYAPYVLRCGQDGLGRCDGGHSAGSNSDELGNTRKITMPGEPFGVTISEDGASLLVTHQNEQKTSLFATGLSRNDPREQNPDVDSAPPPHLDFILEGVPIGGVGVAPVPHDRQGWASDPVSFPRPSYLQTSRFAAQVALVRQYPDSFGRTMPSTPLRPFLDQEAVFPVSVGAGGTDSRGIVIDPTPRLACKARVAPVDLAQGRDSAKVAADLEQCARRPARVFIAHRTPASVLMGEVGSAPGPGERYDPDRIVLHTMLPVSTGPSKLYLAPVVERDGRYGLRLFVVCFDSATVFVFDPENGALENVIRTGLGPFAMAFDPFDMAAVARHDLVPPDTFDTSVGHLYRFAYLASFTNSFVQIIDLDNAVGGGKTYERVVFTLGRPTTPKGS